MKKNSISQIQVKHVANLAHLHLSSKKLKLYTEQLRDILDYVEELSKIDTSEVDPTYQTIDGSTNIYRQDKVSDSLPHKIATSQAAAIHKGYFVAENVFGNKSKPKSLSAKPTKNRPKLDQYNAALTKVDANGTIGHKDLFLTQSVETTAGSKVLENYVAQYSSTVVKRLEKAGYKTKYKLNQDAWGHGSSGENSDYGPILNPWDKTKTPGGSSSGSAVAVATGMVEMATGTDTCGSIRLPSNYTGVTGIKPTYGAISRYGVIAFASSLDCPGILAPSVTSVKKFFNLITGPDNLDATSQSPQRKKTNYKFPKVIGIPKEFFAKGISPKVETAVKKAADDLRSHGFKIKTISLPHTKYGVAAYYIINPTETASNLARYTGIRYGKDRSSFGSEAQRRIMLGTFASSAGYVDRYYEQAAKVRTLIINDFHRAYKKVDVILGPVAPTPPFKLGEKVDDPLEMYLTDVHAAPVSLSGIPALSLPCGFTPGGLPIGMQLIGPRWSETQLFQVGEIYQRLTDWHTRKPKTN